MKRNLTLCNDGERHAIALELRHCGDPLCADRMRGHCPGRYVYAVYKACGKVRRDYVGKIEQGGVTCQRSNVRFAENRSR